MNMCTFSCQDHSIQGYISSSIVTRCWHPEGQDLELNAYMEQMPQLLDELGAELEKLLSLMRPMCKIAITL